MANAVPVPLGGSVLSIWLSEAGFAKDQIGFFSLAGIPLALKFMWVLLVDYTTIPFFNLCPRKGWVLFALSGIVLSLLALSFLDLSCQSGLLVLILVCLSLFTGCLYIVGISYELESIPERDYSFGSAFVITGYRLGLLSAGAGALYVAHLLSWSWMFRAMAVIICVCLLCIAWQKEPYKSVEVLESRRKKISGYSSLFTGFWVETIFVPIKLLFDRSDWKMILLILLGFKLSDHLIKSMTGIFYLSLGFSKADLALASKVWGFGATICGAFFGGYLFRKKDPFFACCFAGTVHTVALGGYYLLTFFGKSYYGLYTTIALENFTGGIAMTCFIFFLWRVCSTYYAPFQYAIMWSLFSLKADILSCAGGVLAAHCSWDIFFLSVTILGLIQSGVFMRVLRNQPQVRYV